MRFFSLGIIFGVFALALLKVVSIVVRKRQRNAEAARRGCLPPPTVHKKDFIGLSTLRESIRATKENRGPQYVVETTDSVGKDVHTVRVPVLDYELLVTRDPENVRAMLSAQSHDFDIRPRPTNSFMPMLGQGLFTSRGEAWKNSRALVRPEFSREELSNLDLAERHVQALLKMLKVGEKGWTEKVDLSPLFYNFTLDTATEFLYGQWVHSQDLAAQTNSTEIKDMDGPNRAEFGHHLDEGKKWIDRRGAMAKYHWLMNSKEFSYHCSEIRKFVDWFVQERLRRGPEQNQLAEAMGKKKFVLLDALAEHTQNPVELRNESLAVLVAGRDTTAALLGWMFYILAGHPRVFEKLRATILKEFGADPTSGELSFATLRSCQYLQNCIHEIIRVVGVVPMNERGSIRDTILPRGGGPDGTKPIFVPKGQQILIPTCAMQHRAIWGDDVEDFKPERWDGRKVGFEFVPFGNGPRMCLGQQFSRTETSYLVVRFLQRFDKIENMEPPGPIRLHNAIENRSGTGVQVRLHEARN